MAYKLESTENPLGHKPWSFATSNSGLRGLLSRGDLGRYNVANFVIPTNTILAPNQTPIWNPPGAGMGRYDAASFVIPTSGSGDPLNAPRWQPGLGDYQVDPATLPPPPAGQMYNAQYQLVPVPQTNYTPWIVLGVALAGGAAWYLYTHHKTPKMKLPVVSPATAGVRL